MRTCTTSKELLVLALISLLATANNVSAQIDESRVSPHLKEHVGRASQEVASYERLGQTERGDSVRLALARYLFEEYLKVGDTESGKFAVHFAFLNWANAGAATDAMAAISRIGSDSNVWSFVVRPLRSAINASGEYDADDYIRVLRTLDGNIADPRGQAAISLELGEYALDQGDTLAAKEAYRSAVELDADSIIVNIALGHLYEIESLNVGELAPFFEAQTIKGDQLSLRDLRGRVVLIEFWATWCGPCMPEIPYLKETWSRFKGDDFALIGISLDANRERVAQFVVDEDIQWPQIQEPNAFRGRIADLYNVSGIPRTYLIDTKGRIVAKDFRKSEIPKMVRAALDRTE